MLSKILNSSNTDNLVTNLTVNFLAAKVALCNNTGTNTFSCEKFGIH